MGIFTPIYMKKNLNGNQAAKAEKAVRGMSDVDRLADVFRNAPDSWIRRVAARRLIDLKAPQALLAEITEKVEAEGLADDALAGVTDAALLERIAMSGRHRSTRQKAVQSIGDQAALARLARGAGDPEVRTKAVWRLEEPEALQDIARNEKDAFLRLGATQNIRDVNTLTRIALADPDADVRRAAAGSESMTDPVTLALLAKKDANVKVRLAAVKNKNLTDPAVLAGIALGDDEHIVRSAAVIGGRIADPEVLKKIALDKGPKSPRLFAIDRLDDEATLRQIADEADPGDPRPRWLAAVKLSRTNPEIAVAPLVRLMALDKDAHRDGDFCLKDLRREAVRFLEARYRQTRDAAIAELPDGMYGWIEPGDACMPIDEKIHFDLARGRN